MEIFLNNSLKYIKEEIGDLEKENTYHFFCEGKWSMHDLLSYLLSVSGPSRVWISTFSISEPALRTIYNCLDKELITELNCLLNLRVKKHKLDLLMFANNIVNKICLANNHSKIILIENDAWKIVVNGSANMTVNSRYEAGVICTIGSIYDKYKLIFEDALEKSLNFKI